MGYFYKSRRAARRQQRLLAYASKLAAAYSADPETASISTSASEGAHIHCTGHTPPLGSSEAEGEGTSTYARFTAIARKWLMPSVVMLQPSPIIFGAMIILSFLATFINMAEQIFLAFLGDWVGEKAWKTEGENWGVSSEDDNLFWLNVGFGFVLTADDFKCVILDYLPEELPLLELAVTFIVTLLQMVYLPHFWIQNGGELSEIPAYFWWAVLPLEIANELLNFALNRFAPVDPDDDGSEPNAKDGAVLTKAIKAIDTNGDGIISPKELYEGIKASPPLLLMFVMKNVFAVAATINTIQIGAYFIYPSMIRPPYMLSSLRFTILIIAWMTFYELKEKALALGYIAIPRKALLMGSERLSKIYSYMCCKTPLTTLYNRHAGQGGYIGLVLSLVKFLGLKLVYADPVVLVALITAIAMLNTPAFGTMGGSFGIGGASADHTDLAPWCDPNFDWCKDRHWWCTDSQETAVVSLVPTAMPTAMPTVFASSTTAEPTAEDLGHDCDPDLNWLNWDRNWGITIFVISLGTFLTGGHFAHYVLDAAGFFIFPLIAKGIDMNSLYPPSPAFPGAPRFLVGMGPFMRAANANSAESGGANWETGVSPRVQPEKEGS